jgi:FAD/FMN-containing dehydrogenase
LNPSYLEDASGYLGSADEVFVPDSEDELQAVLRRALATNTPVTIAGAGTGVTGARVPLGGWVVSLERFRKVEIEHRRAVVGPGLLLKELQAASVPTGQFYAPDPTEYSASLGGTIATNASGSRSFRCGDTRRHVLGLRVALIDGTVREFRRGEKVDFPVPAIPRPETTKHTAGFLLQPDMDWVDLFIGSEGTLGVVTEAAVRLVKMPRELLAGVIFFPADGLALEAVEQWRSVRRLRMLEYLDAGSLRLLAKKYPDVPGKAAAALLIEQEILTESDMDDWEPRLETSGALVETSWFAAGDQDRERFRQFRHSLPEAVNTTVRQRGLLKMGTDFAVPLARNKEMMAFYRCRLEETFPDQYVIFGHIGDAHVHVNVLPKDGEESERAKALITELAQKVVSFGGTVSAEHGLGKRKIDLLEIQYTPAQIEMMKAVKRRLDPKWLLGQGTLFRM